jgi:hypothetical protein
MLGQENRSRRSRRFIAQREINSRELRGHLRGSCAPVENSLEIEAGDGEGDFMATIKNDILPGNFTTAVYSGLTHPSELSS